MKRMTMTSLCLPAGRLLRSQRGRSMWVNEERSTVLSLHPRLVAGLPTDEIRACPEPANAHAPGPISIPASLLLRPDEVID